MKTWRSIYHWYWREWFSRKGLWARRNFNQFLVIHPVKNADWLWMFNLRGFIADHRHCTYSCKSMNRNPTYSKNHRARNLRFLWADIAWLGVFWLMFRWQEVIGIKVSEIVKIKSKWTVVYCLRLRNDASLICNCPAQDVSLKWPEEMTFKLTWYNLSKFMSKTEALVRLYGLKVFNFIVLKIGLLWFFERKIIQRSCLKKYTVQPPCEDFINWWQCFKKTKKSSCFVRDPMLVLALHSPIL